MNFLRKMSHVRWALVGYDLIIYAFSVLVFFWHYRGGGILKPTDILNQSLLALVCVFIPRFIGLVYAQIWRYGGVQSYMRLICTDTVGAFCYGVLNLLLPVKTIATARVISVMSINMLGCLVIRMIYRYAFKFSRKDTIAGQFFNTLLRIFAGKEILEQKATLRMKRKIAILGAGRVGVSLAEDLMNNAEATAVPVCFIDVKPEKVGRLIRGLPVLSEAKTTAALLGEYEVDELVFAVPSMSMETKKNVYERFKDMGLPVKIYDFPTMRTAGAKRQLRNFEVEEVLFRAPIVVTDEKLPDYYKDKVILVTGGGGSIGSELSRQVADMGPKQLILLDIYENGVYDVQQELRMKYGKALDVRLEIMSITDKISLDSVFAQYRPQIVINAAAHKHVPLMEHNCLEAVVNNVFGMENVVELCEEYGVERFMTLSTDKAVNPTNVMGATKRMCEYIMQAHSTKGNMICSATRFGNVLGSAGSVIPLFKRQIAAGGPVTLTDNRIIRYFMTIPEASQLVLQSGAWAKNGELFVLDMGSPVKILELAENMIRLSGLTPYKDIEIVETGLRPGEKLYEELLVKRDNLERTDNNLIFIEREEPVTMDKLEEKLQLLRAAVETRSNDKVKEALREVVPTFYKPEEINR